MLCIVEPQAKLKKVPLRLMTLLVEPPLVALASSFSIAGGESCLFSPCSHPFPTRAALGFLALPFAI
uniref:Uncharacterized protein n=1 Tax=Arundo donax TaxID=35708 RepID=A0A0A8YC70_ARUDO